MPKISVILSIYNHRTYINECIQSILDQSYKDWELIIIDDGSTDNSYEELKRFEQIDNRIILVKNQKNQGLPKSLNYGISLSNGEFIIRVDADDICIKDRFEILIKNITKKENSNIDVLGSNAYFVNKENKIIGQSSMPINFEDFKKEIYKRNPFIHSSVIIRKSFLSKNNLYDKKFIKAQDYDLWLRGYKYNNYKNLEKILLNYRFLNSKDSQSDFYGFYAIFLNCLRKHKFIFSIVYSFRYLSVILLKKLGYKSKSLY